MTASTWAVWGNESVRESEGERRLRFIMQAFSSRQVTDITDQMMSNLIYEPPHDAVVPGPEGRVALVYQAGDDAGVVVFRGDGQMAAAPAMLRGVESLAVAEEGEYQANNYIEAVPVVWHNELGLVFSHDTAGFFTFRPDPESLPREYQDSWKPFAFYEISARGGRRLSEGRVLLLFEKYGVVISPDGQTVTPVGKDSLERRGGRRRIRDIFPDGSVLVDEWGDGESSAWTFHPLLRGVVTASPAQPKPDDQPGFARLTPGLWAAFQHEERTGSDGTRFRIEPEDLMVVEGDEKIEVVLNSVYQDLESLELPVETLRPRQLPWAVLLALRPMLLDLRKGPPAEWLLRGSCINQDARPIVRFRDYRLLANGKESVPQGPFGEVELRDEPITACAAVDRDRVAIAYVSGRIEVVSLRDGGSVMAVGFTLSTPQDLAVSRGRAGSYLVVVSDEVSWFKLESWS